MWHKDKEKDFFEVEEKNKSGAGEHAELGNEKKNTSKNAHPRRVYENLWTWDEVPG